MIEFGSLFSKSSKKAIFNNAQYYKIENCFWLIEEKELANMHEYNQIIRDSFFVEKDRFFYIVYQKLAFEDIKKKLNNNMILIGGKQLNKEIRLAFKVIERVLDMKHTLLINLIDEDIKSFETYIKQSKAICKIKYGKSIEHSIYHFILSSNAVLNISLKNLFVNLNQKK